MRILRAHDHRRMPWKNGGGETVEIAVHPEGSDTSSFGWRISMATVASDGPFSVFPGIDRTLSVLSGDGMDLTIEGLGDRLLTPGDKPLSFPADSATTARLVAGPITDLNVMSRRGAFAHRVTRHSIDMSQAIATDAQWRVLFCVSGEIAVSAGETRETLRAHDAAIVTVAGAVSVSVQTEASFFVIEIRQAT